MIDPNGLEAAREAARPLRDRADNLQRLVSEANQLIRELAAMGARVEIDVHEFTSMSERPRPLIEATVLVEVK